MLSKNIYSKVYEIVFLEHRGTMTKVLPDHSITSNTTDFYSDVFVKTLEDQMQVANKLLKCWMYIKNKKDVLKEKQTKDRGKTKKQNWNNSNKNKTRIFLMFKGRGQSIFFFLIHVARER